MIYRLLPLGSHPIPSHQLTLAACHQKLEELFDHHKYHWHRVLFIEFTGRHRTDLNKDKHYSFMPFDADDLNQCLGRGILAQCLPTTNWEADRKKCLEEFDLYYHNCLTARALMDIFGSVHILPLA